MGEIVALSDGGGLHVERIGKGHPLIMLHGGPGLDHHEFRPWLDPLGDRGLELIMVDMRGQGQSPRVDPQTLSIQTFSHDVDRLAEALELDAFALMGHSFGAIVSLSHALERGTAGHYVISAGAASTESLMTDVEREIALFEPASMREQIRRSWEQEATVSTVEQMRDLMASQMPFHFWEMGDAYSQFMLRDETVYAPEVLARFARDGYGDFDWSDHLRWIRRPMLVLCGRYDRTCTLARSEEIHREVEGSQLVVIEKAAHMTQVEQPKAVIDAIRAWFIDQGVLADPSAPPAAPSPAGS